jgi:isopenicillin-N N-acyltransferase-like protein
VRNTLVTYRRLLHEAAGVEPADLAARGAAVGERIERERPDLVFELEGIAAGAGVPVEELLAVNARTELLAGRPVAGECTLAGVLGPAKVRLAQNWDWHPALAASTVLWTIPLEDGGWMTTVTEAGMLGKLGLSSHGLAVGLNFLASTHDDGADGMPVHVLLRMVLDSCRSAAEALELLLRTAVGASACVTIAGAEADGHALAAVELSPAGPALVWPDGAGRLVHANHFLAGPVAGSDAIAHAEPASLLRRRHAQARLEGGAGLEDVLRSHFPRPYGICRHEDARDAWAERRATLVSVVMDPGAGTLALAAGRPCECPFETIAPRPCPSR